MERGNAHQNSREIIFHCWEQRKKTTPRDRTTRNHWYLANERFRFRWRIEKKFLKKQNKAEAAPREHKSTQPKTEKLSIQEIDRTPRKTADVGLGINSE